MLSHQHFQSHRPWGYTHIVAEAGARRVCVVFVCVCVCVCVWGGGEGWEECMCASVWVKVSCQW